MVAMDERWAWVALASVPAVSWNVRRYHDLLRLGSPAAVFRASVRALTEVAGAEAAVAIASADASRLARSQADAAARAGAHLVILGDEDYPAGLRAVPLPPPFLLVRGEVRREDALGVAIVGSRRASVYGLRTAEGLGAELGARGVTVVSGLARGVDTAAHQGALGAGGRTLAVLGSGIDVIYPPENRGLAAEIEKQGALISQFPMGTAPLPQHFPLRNRVIAGLTLGTVVVEAAERSGALITARHAGELGREVYAVPGNVSSPGSQGTNRLIQDGAKLVQGWEDVVAEWPPEWRRALRGAAAGRQEPPAPSADPAERAILALVGDEPLAVDAVVERSGLPTGAVAARLSALEVRGLVRRVAGQRYVRG
jgi:DNA processing protein